MSIIDIEDGVYGKRAIVKARWHDSFLEILKANNILELELNESKGFQNTDLNFLKFLPELISFTIIDFNIKSISGIHTLQQLRSLNILTYCKTPIDFSCFPNLELCSFEWRKGSENLFSCKNLTKISLNHFKKSEINISITTSKIEELTILNSDIDTLFFISNLNNLKKLSLNNLKKLITISGIEKFVELTELEINNCPLIDSIEEIFTLHKLVRLLLIDLSNIKSLKGIVALSYLKTLLFYGSTNILDGDLSEIKDLHCLNEISYQNRKHYNIKREVFS